MATPKSKRGSTRTDSSARLKRLENRVAKLESHVTSLRAERAGVLAIEAGLKPIIFSLQPGGPAVVRLTLDSSEQLVLGSAPVSSHPRANGTTVNVLVELWGTPGEKATINVTNAVPTPLVSTIPQGTSHWADPRTLTTKW